MDLDGDGYLSMYELEYFYEEQLRRMEAIGLDTLPFEDCLCQVSNICVAYQFISLIFKNNFISLTLTVYTVRIKDINFLILIKCVRGSLISGVFY